MSFFLLENVFLVASAAPCRDGRIGCATAPHGKRRHSRPTFVKASLAPSKRPLRTLSVGVNPLLLRSVVCREEQKRRLVEVEITQQRPKPSELDVGVLLGCDEDQLRALSLVRCQLTRLALCRAGSHCGLLLRGWIELVV